MPSTIPVTVVSGFLGAGKTTLIGRILKGDHGLKVTAIVNDFGQLAIDARLVRSASADVLELRNGCVCCSVRNDLVAMLDRLLRRRPVPEYLVIECSGAADPERLVPSFGYPRLKDRYRLDGVLTVVDLAGLDRIEGALRRLAEAQIAAADIVLLNKIDIAPPEASERFRRDWLFADSRVLESAFAAVPTALILGVGAHDPEGGAGQEREFVSPADALLETASWECARTLSLVRLRAAIAHLPVGVFRAKGVFRVDALPDAMAVLQVVGSRSEWSRLPKTDPDERSRALFIGPRGAFDAAALRSSLDGCV